MSKFDKLDRNKMKQRLDVLDKGTSDRFETIPVDAISPNPHQPRKNFDEVQLQELAHSIKEDGLLQPVVVKKNLDGDGYILIAGERRWRAVKLLGKSSIKAIILSNDTIDLKVLALIENTQRTNLSPIEEAISMKELMNLKGLSKKELAELVSKSYDHTVSLLSLADLPKKIQEDLQDNNAKVSIQTLQALNRIEEIDDAVSLYFKIKDNKLNKKESLLLISKLKKKKITEPNIIVPQNEKSSSAALEYIVVNESSSSLNINVNFPLSKRKEFNEILNFLSKKIKIIKKGI